MKVVGVIPARMESSRLPGKPLIDIEGLPMVVHVFKRAQVCKDLDEVHVATDSYKIFEVVKKYGGRPIMTSSKHKTGTDRVAEAINGIDADIIVNIQGDEPLLHPKHISKVIEPLKKEDDIQVAILVTPYTKKESPSDIKAVLDLNKNILYCSRTDLPSNTRSEVNSMWKMCFLVPFKREFLLKYTSWEQTPLEKIEFNEYLRILEHGFKIRAVPVDNAYISVDTPEDLIEVRRLMKADKLKCRYIK